MKKIILTLFVLILILVIRLSAQNVSINATGGTPDPSAMLDIQSGTMGLSIPNVALTASNSSAPIAATPKIGLIVYNTATAGISPNNVIPGFYFWNGTKWIAFYGNGSNDWALTGNSGTTPGTHFIGSTDAVDFVTKTNNAEVMRATSAGLIGIGTTAPAAKLDVAASTTTNNTVVNATGSINDFLQFNVQNTNTSSKAQSGYSATADNGTATTGFAWMGINNSTFNFPTAYNIGLANDVSYIASGQDMYIANANNTKSIIFSTGTSTTPFFNERMRITNAGYVGIGTSSPAYPLDVQIGNASAPITGYGYLNSSGTTGFNAGSSAPSAFSARFSGRIISPEFNAQSDARIKEVKGISNSENDLAILKELKITDYEMKDKVQWGNKKFKKVIAQEVEKIYPQAVSNSIGFIPNIYQLASKVEILDSSIIIKVNKELTINNQTKRVRIIADAGNLDLEIVSMSDNKTLILKKGNYPIEKDEKIFVYGEEINDFRVVDYEALSTLNISAIQQLDKIIKIQQAQIELLKKENTSLKSELPAKVELLRAELDELTKEIQNHQMNSKK